MAVSRALIVAAAAFVAASCSDSPPPAGNTAAAPPAAAPSAEPPLSPTPAERRATLDRMIPKHEGYLGALAPENLSKERPAPPFDLTGTWFVDLSRAFSDFRFGPPYPEFIGQAKAVCEYS